MDWGNVAEFWGVGAIALATWAGCFGAAVLTAKIIGKPEIGPHLWFMYVAIVITIFVGMM